MTEPHIPHPAGTREPVKANVFERMISANTAPLPLFPCYGPGAILVTAALTHGQRRLLHHRQLTRRSRPPVHPGPVRGQRRNPRLLTLTQRQRDADDPQPQREAIQFRCENCGNLLLEFDYDARGLGLAGLGRPAPRRQPRAAVPAGHRPGRRTGMMTPGAAAQNLFTLAKDVLPGREVSFLGPDADPQLHLSRVERFQPYFVVHAKDTAIAQMSGSGQLEFRYSNVLHHQLEPGDVVYIPAGTPHRYRPREESVQLRYIAHARRDACARFAADAGLRTCPRSSCVGVWRD
jgi:hypothetical protein